jgi:cytochrome P450
MAMGAEPVTITISDYEGAKEAYRAKPLRQALYDEGEVVMGDVLVNLHGEEHRQRRRLENRLFRRDVFLHYQEELFPPIIEETLKPHVAEGHAELVELSHQLMMNLAALTAGVDRPLGTPEETFHLYDYLMKFIQGATLAHYTGDKDGRREEVRQALVRFDEEFLIPSADRRRALLQQLEDGTLTEEELPKDVLMILVRNEDELHLPHDVILREIAFFLLAGAHTSATAFTRTLDNIFSWVSEHPEDLDLVRTDRHFLQACVHETIRLFPSSPVAMRWALEPLTLQGGELEVPQGAKVIIDLMSVNRDPSVFGPTAGEFDPRRETPERVAPWGLSFGGGMHICIGQDLAAGVVGGPSAEEEVHLFGLVPVAVQAMIDRGARRDPEDPPVMDENTKRPYWARYPVRFGH